MGRLPDEIGCIVVGHLEPVWMVSISMVSRRQNRWVASACKGAVPRVPRGALDTAAASGWWSVVRWLHHDLLHPWTERTMVVAAAHGRTGIFCRLLAEPTCRVDARAAPAALLGCGPAFMEQALATGCPRSPLLTTVAVLSGHRRVARDLIKRGHVDWLTNLCAVAFGHDSLGDDIYMGALDHVRITRWIECTERWAPPEYRRLVRCVVDHAERPLVLAHALVHGSAFLPRRESPLHPREAALEDPLHIWILNVDRPAKAWEGWGSDFCALSWAVRERQRLAASGPRTGTRLWTSGRTRPRAARRTHRCH
jgi:hypothetical protein